MRHQVLIETESLVKEALRFCTNQAYVNGNKITYEVKWEKGVHALLDDKGKKITNYHSLCLTMIDKRNSPVGKKIELVTNHYPAQIGVSTEKLEEQAYKELILNGLASLINITYAGYIEQTKKDYTKVEDVKVSMELETLKDAIDESKPKIIV
jgi:hypothetical protein